MEPVRRKNLGQPDESVRLPGVSEDLVDIGGYTVARTVQAAGWRYSRDDPRAEHDGGWCKAHHVGLVLSGRWGAELRDGTVLEWGPDDVYDCPPDHDGYTIGDESAVLIEWAGVRTFVGARAGLAERVLAALLFSDIVDSTVLAERMGDVAWHDLLSRHYHTASEQIETFGGRRVQTTGDGVLAMFDSPARAVRCAAAIRETSKAQGLRIRAGVHVGEIALTADGIRGVAVHEAARIMAAAEPGEVLVSEITSSLAAPAGLRFADRGEHSLKGIAQPRHLLALVDGP